MTRRTHLGRHLPDRIYGTRINLLADDPTACLHIMEDASVPAREPVTACPSYRVTLTVPAATAAARADEFELADQHEHQHANWANLCGDSRLGCKEPTAASTRKWPEVMFERSAFCPRPSRPPPQAGPPTDDEAVVRAYMAADLRHRNGID